jgi:CubicO group peptidase (beta-lactamase class C family)
MIARRGLLSLAGATLLAPRAFAQSAGAGSLAAVSPNALSGPLLDTLPAMLRSEYPATLCLRVTQKGGAVVDYRREDVSADSLFRIYSITKSVLATLVGIALDSGAITSLDRTVGSYFPEIDLAAADPRARTVTLRHMLTMTSGWDTTKGPPGGPPAVTTSGLFRPMAEDPGATFCYDNNSSNILGILLARAVGEPLEAFAERALFRPLGIDAYHWRTTPDGFAAGSGGLSLSIASLVRFGSFAMQGGVWNGRRLVSRGYMDEMLSRKVAVNAAEGLDYGFLWFMQKTPDGRHESFIAQGLGGQVLQVVPDLGLIVATTTEPGDKSNTGFIRSAILPAMKG